MHHLGQLLDLPVDLGRADAHAAGIERRVAAAVDDHPAVRRDLRPVAVAPRRSGTCSKYAARYLAPSGSFQNATGMLGNGAVHTSSPGLPTTESPVLVEDLDLHAERARLQLAAPHRSDRIAAGEARDDVRAAADAAQPHVALHVSVDVVEAVRGERAPRRENRVAARSRSCVSIGRRPSFSASASHFALVPNTVMRSSAAMSHRIGRSADERRAVVQHDRRAERRGTTRASSTSSSRTS